MKKLNEMPKGQSMGKENLPEWFDQNINKEKISVEDEKSLKDMLREFS